ncbi:MAG TPA: PASTA domain-containing protein [Gaiellaceae bacterium]|nr:PASTA domain-containing protein [Gaiellaceae bacterium]
MNPADPDRDPWPTRESDTAIVHRETLAGGAPPPPVYPGPPPTGPVNERRFGAGMLLALAVIALAVAGAAIAYFLIHRDNGSQVTTVIQRSTAPTTAPTTTASTRTTPAGKVVPDLTGRSLKEARASLEQLGLKVDVTRATSDKPAGTIVDQAPKPGGKLARGAAVTLSVATANKATTTAPAATTTAPSTTAKTTTAPAEPATATVPDVSSQDESSAVQTLTQAGILPSLVFVPGSDPLGTVTGQAKSSGSTVPYHSHVQINISSGPGDKQQEQVPSVIGQTLQQAVSSVNGAHLRLIYVKFPVDSRSQAGKIVQQSPLGGGHAPQNAQVLVFLGAFRA